MFRVVLAFVYIISGVHIFLGLLSVCVGVISSIKAEVWLAHSVSPIWSGGFFIITGITGILCAKRKSSYIIMCFIAFSVVSMVTAVVSIQLLRLGLLNHTTEGTTYQKDKKDPLIIIALSVAGSECLVCLVSTLLSCRVAKIAKEEMCQQREGMFHVKESADDTVNKTNENETTEPYILEEINIQVTADNNDNGAMEPSDMITRDIPETPDNIRNIQINKGMEMSIFDIHKRGDTENSLAGVASANDVPEFSESRMKYIYQEKKDDG